MKGFFKSLKKLFLEATMLAIFLLCLISAIPYSKVSKRIGQRFVPAKYSFLMQKETALHKTIWRYVFNSNKKAVREIGEVTDYEPETSTLKIYMFKNRLAVVSIFSASFFALFLFLSHILKKKKIKDRGKGVKDILRALGLYYTERTREPLMTRTTKGLVQKTDVAGNKLFKEIEYFPTIDFSQLPEAIIINDVHEKIKNSIVEYHNGLLNKLKEHGFTDDATGEIVKTGYPGQFKIMLTREMDIKEKDMLKSIGWYKIFTKNAIKEELYPVIDINDNDVIVCTKGLDLTKDKIAKGLEVFQNFYKIKLKDFFEQQGDDFILSYQVEHNKSFPLGTGVFDTKKNAMIKTLKRELSKFEITADSAGEINYGISDILEKAQSTTDKERLESKFRNIISKYYSDESDEVESLQLADVNCFKLWEEKVIEPCREEYLKTGKETVFVGELQDSNINYDTQIAWKLTDSPHFLVAGQTRSGKSKTCQSLIMSIAVSIPGVRFYFADGKGSPDYDDFASRLSDFPVAKPNQSDDPLIELANIVLEYWAEYGRRQVLFSVLKDNGIPVSTIVEFNKKLDDIYNEDGDYYIENEDVCEMIQEEMDKKLLEFYGEESPEYQNRKIFRFVLMIDEWAAFCQEAPDKVDKLIGLPGTIFNYIRRLAAEAASYGATIILASQRVQATDFPTPIRANLTNWMIHAVNEGDARFLDLVGVVSRLKMGAYILKIQGLLCRDTNRMNFECRLPYIGDDPSTVVRNYFPEERKKRDFDLDLIYNTGNDGKFDKIDSLTLLKYIKQAFFTREGFEIQDSFNPEHKVICMFAKKDDVNYAVGIIEQEDVDNGLLKRIEDEHDDLFPYRKVFFVRGNKIGPKVIEGMKNSFKTFGPCYFFGESEYVRKLKEAISMYKEGVETPIFEKMLKKASVMDDEIDSLYADDLIGAAEQKQKVSGEKLNKKELDRIREIKDRTKKGDIFEEWFKNLEEFLGHETYTGDEFSKILGIRSLFANPRAEGGLDLCRIIDKESKRVVAIQLKNWPSRSLPTSVVDKMIKTRELYQANGDCTFEKLLIVTTGSVTKQTRNEAERLGVVIIDGKKLDTMVENLYQPEKILDIVDDISSPQLSGEITGDEGLGRAKPLPRDDTKN